MNVIIRNKTKGNVVAENSVVCRSLMSKARGLMFRREAIPMIFEFCSMQRNALHMMFVFFPIDAIFLDDNRKVVEIKKNFRPFRYHSPKKKSMYVIELSAGTVVSKNIQIGDMMNWR